MESYKYFADISEKELQKEIVIPCIAEDNYPCVLIKNARNKSVSSSQSTDNLIFLLDKKLERGDSSFFFHIIKSKKNDFFSRQQFNIIYEYIFGKITDPIESLELQCLINSLEDYFSMTPHKDADRLQIGVYGELLFVKFCKEAGFKNIFEKYHQNFNNKHDIEITDKVRIEIKTTCGEKRIHHFKHNQLFRTDIKVYVASLLLERSQEGETLFELFNEIKNSSNNPDLNFALNKLQIKCGVTEEKQGLSVSIEKAYDQLKIYDSTLLPRLEMSEPNGVSCIEYDVDCSFAEHENIKDFINQMNSMCEN